MTKRRPVVIVSLMRAVCLSEYVRLAVAGETMLEGRLTPSAPSGGGAALGRAASSVSWAATGASGDLPLP